jgi:glyoxylase-like metal-dependent hydrolase (beta-lactamase superfamily II)
MRISRILLYLFFAFFTITVYTSEAVGQNKKANQELEVGDIKVSKIQDAEIYLNLSLLSGIEHLEALQLTSGRDSIQTPVNAFLVQTPKHIILVDAGIGKSGGEKVGHLTDQMKIAGVDPTQVDLILITHFHFDHIGGLLTVDGKRMFSKAIVRAPKSESDYWLGDSSKLPADQRERAQQIKATLQPYIQAGKYQAFLPNESLGDGIKALPANGHTIGHTVYAFSSKGSDLWCIGDLIHIGDIQFTKPSVGVVFDTDSPMAIRERLNFFQQAASGNVIIAGAHLPEMVHIKKSGNSFVVVPVKTR